MEQSNNQNRLDDITNRKIAMRVSIASIIINLVLSFFKIMAGIISNSGAMISDGVHSASDVFSTFIVIAGVIISSRKSDKEHQYGHERLECVAAIILAVILGATGIGIGIGGIQKIVGGNYGNLEIPGLFALFAAILSIAVKEWMYWFTRAAAKKINSSVLLADAWHHRSDSLSSIGAFIGILGARLGFPVLDPIASVVICVFILKVAVDVFRDAIDKLIDKSCNEETVQRMKQIICKQEGVVRIDIIKTRLFGSRIYADIEIAADGKKTLFETNKIAEQVHDAIENEFPMVKHCMVRVNPSEREDV